MNPHQMDQENTWATAAVAALLTTLIKRAADVEPWLKEAEDLLWTPL